MEIFNTIINRARMPDIFYSLSSHVDTFSFGSSVSRADIPGFPYW